VLSGFLITSLLLAEREATGRLDLAGFYWRRAVRLCPALFALLAVYLAVAPLLWPGQWHTLHAAVAALYLSDYGFAFWSVPDLLNHTWSLSVEEHFYVLWPLVVLATRRWSTRKLLAALALAWVAATLWRAACVLEGQSWQMVYYRFDTRLSGLVLGSLLAVLVRDGAALAAVRRYLPRAWLWLPVAALSIYRFQWGAMDVESWGLTVIELASFAVLLELHDQPAGAFARVLSPPPLVWLGQMSYGIYLWHYPIMRVLREVTSWEMQLLGGAALSIAVAALSYYPVEAWARHVRGRRPVLPGMRATGAE
jgi:peptidoglycan/LPS O-acetylase OafA/YrhL